MTQYLNIALPIPVRRAFTYAADAAVPVGVRVLVPFGKNILTGVVVGANVPPPREGEVRPIVEVLDDSPVFSAPMLELTRWMAEYYLSSWGEALRTALPQGMSPQSVVRIRLLRDPDETEMEMLRRTAPRRAQLVEMLRSHKEPLSLNYLRTALRTDAVLSVVHGAERTGLMALETEIEKEIGAKKQLAVRPAPLVMEPDMLPGILEELARAKKQAELLAQIVIDCRRKPEEPLLVSEVLARVQATRGVLNALADKELVLLYEAEIDRAAQEQTSSVLARRNEGVLDLTVDQQHAIDKIQEGIAAGTHKTFLLHGVTGSGKTLVYLHAIRSVLDAGKTVLVLLPEIALTPQAIDRYRSAIPERIGVYHSRMSAGERYDTWRAAEQGAVRLVVGTRSALFLPMPSLGLIIVDEEHDSSYKQDSPAPRYNARDSAVVRGKLENCCVVLGSATPSMESMYAARSARYHLLEMPGRADGAALPAIHVVDLVQEKKNGRLHGGTFSETLITAIEERIAKQEGVILLHNRRGYASRFECTDCGSVPECPHCSVSLTWHKRSNTLRCHYCAYSQRATRECQQCGSLEVDDHGTGTQKVEDELRTLLLSRGVEASIERMDLDTTARKGSHRALLERFGKKEIQILIGTQMVAKGMDFPHVSLVGVVNADIQLRLQDFRACERAFQLLTQVAGRAGRSGEVKGEVLIQTRDPLNDAIIAARQGSYESFYGDEIVRRRSADYPPFTRFVTILISGRDEQTVNDHAHKLSTLIPRQSDTTLKLGPTEPSIVRLRSEYRRLMVIKNSKERDPSGKYMREMLRSALLKYRHDHGISSVTVTVDVDALGTI